MAKQKRTVSGLLDVIERYAYGDSKLRSALTNEMRMFRNAEGDFGRVSARSDRNVMLPDEWWKCYGSSAPNLQTLAIRVLSQTCSATCCERNWSVFEHIHSKKRNRLEHQRLNDLVYVRYNLRLQQRIYMKARNYDPIDFEDFENDAWIMEDEPATLTVEELESFRAQLEDGNFQLNLNDDDMLNLDGLDLDGDEDDDCDDSTRDDENGVTENITNGDGLLNVDLNGDEEPTFGPPQWDFNHA